MKHRIVAALALISTTVACGPRVSQWVQVTDCAQKHVVVPGARVYIFESGIHYTLQGGQTDAQGNTWGSFPVENGSQVMAVPSESAKLEDRDHRAGQPRTPVAPNPQEPIFTCMNR